jgi:hypothetical protein
MRRILIAAVAFGMVAFVVPSASAGASSPDHIWGGCFLDVNQSDPQHMSGVIGDVSATVDASGAPTAATVSCSVVVNGVEAPGTRFSYSGNRVQAGADAVSFAATDSDIYWMCEQDVFADNTSVTKCPSIQDAQLPPQDVVELLNILFYDADPIVCPELKALAAATAPSPSSRTAMSRRRTPPACGRA